jgi:mono/diheme cytochrome c family protein
MSRRVVNVFLLLAFVASLGLHVAASRDLSQRNIEAMPEMGYSPAYDTFAPNPNFPDGKTLQLPEPGTIPRGRLPLHYGPSLEDAVRAGAELHNPFSAGPPLFAASTVALLASPQGQGPLVAVSAFVPVRNFPIADPRARERGAFLFRNYCQMCHGPEGKGDGPMLQHGIPPSASLLADNAVQMKDGQLFHVLTYGQRNMSSHAAQMSREDRWKVILHVRALQQKAAGEKRP